MEKRFYQFTKTPLPIAATKLAERVHAQGKTLNILTDENLAKPIDEALWAQSEFLPHALEQPDGVSTILISGSPQSADVYFLLGDLNFDGLEGGLICYLFQSSDVDIVASRRQDWKNFNDMGEYLTYWAENENGQWEKKFEANPPQNAQLKT